MEVTRIFINLTSGWIFFYEFAGEDELGFDRFLLLVNEIYNFRFDIGDERLGIQPFLPIYSEGFQIPLQRCLTFFVCEPLQSVEYAVHLFLQVFDFFVHLLLDRFWDVG